MGKTDSLEQKPDFREQEIGFIYAHRIKLIIAVLVLVLAVGYLAFNAWDSAKVYYYTVSEIKEIGPTSEGQFVRVSGKLIDGTFERVENTTLASFILTDGTETVQAIHQGIIPDLFFNEHSEIILEGRYTQDKVFRSKNIIVKCPSKYVASSS